MGVTRLDLRPEESAPASEQSRTRTAHVGPPPCRSLGAHAAPPPGWVLPPPPSRRRPAAALCLGPPASGSLPTFTPPA